MGQLTRPASSALEPATASSTSVSTTSDNASRPGDDVPWPAHMPLCAHAASHAHERPGGLRPHLFQLIASGGTQDAREVAQTNHIRRFETGPFPPTWAANRLPGQRCRPAETAFSTGWHCIRRVGAITKVISWNRCSAPRPYPSASHNLNCFSAGPFLALGAGLNVTFNLCAGGTSILFPAGSPAIVRICSSGCLLHGEEMISAAGRRWASAHPACWPPHACRQQERS